MPTRLTSSNSEVWIGENLPTVLINDQLRIMDQDPVIFEQLQKKDVSRLLEIAQGGKAAGLDMVDILIFHQDLEEVELLPRIAYAVKKKWDAQSPWIHAMSKRYLQLWKRLHQTKP